LEAFLKEVQLSSGAILKIGSIPFEDANNLKKAIMRELKGISVISTRQLMDLYKDYLCTALASEDVERCLWECMKRCIYNRGAGDLKIDKESFQHPDARIDFTEVQMEVAVDCLTPFGKSLLHALQRMLALGAVNIPQ
jgi:hypothetical protein